MNTFGLKRNLSGFGLGTLLGTVVTTTVRAFRLFSVTITKAFRKTVER